MKFKVHETHDGLVFVGDIGYANISIPEGEDRSGLVLSRHEALTLAIQLIVSSTPLSGSQVAKALDPGHE